ncbi:squamous cell carcinoma antigen recognized by T-cells 3-like [Pollicipes pollicipes]|uniref:squamous cell carcinoma antigen recognized by T-cells 3-like n=1 Tax=Pollicipes pollicipes TaxID=41117 RepID=UPI00188545E2|nr:squamous cell carcinoma antigen recognized by T-cells 3-like [Pollicipes pollicipes]
MTMESKDEAMSQDSSDSDDSMQDDAQEEEISKLMQELEASPYNYDSHVRLLHLLGTANSREMLREARETMNKYFPLSPDLWLSWIKDEEKSMETDEDRERLLALCDRAVREYSSVDLWLEYCQLAIGGLAAEDGPVRVRALFERALIAVGLHVTKGTLIWEAYREFENAMCSGVPPGEESAAAAARDRVTALFRRQLRVPLQGLELTWAEYEAWLAAAPTAAQPDANDRREYDKACKRLETLLPFEEALTSDETGGSVAAYQQYLSHELAHGTPARVQHVLERAVLDNCLELELWQAYTRYLDFELRPASEVTLAVHERAVRHLAWSAELWEHYIRAVERAGAPLQRAEELVTRALSSGLQTPADYQLVWLTWLDLYRRRLSQDGTKGADLMEKMRVQFNKACEHLAQTFGLEGDPECTLLQYWASLEAANGLLSEAVALWNDIMSQGHDKSARMWLQYLRLVQRFGTPEQLRKLLVRALDRTVDWPESVYELWAAFERERGTLQTWDEMTYRYRVRMNRIKALRAKEAEKEKMELDKAEAKVEKKKQKDKEWRKNKRQELKTAKSAAKELPAKTENTSPQKRKLEADDDEMRPAPAKRTDANGDRPAPPPGFKPPPPPGFKPPPPPGFKPPPPPGFKPPPPPGFKPPPPPSETREDERRDRPPKGDEGGGTGDVERDSRTVFLSNLDFATDEARLRSHLADVGDITDVRLVKDYKGRSKGFAYLEFSTIAAAEVALQRDRAPIDGRPCFVSRLRRGAQQQPQQGFKYNTGLERNKLFVRGLPFSATADDLRQKFSTFGELKDVRLVTFRNGHSKGLAYIEFNEEAAAAEALLKTDSTVMDGKTISVAISDPPKAKGRPTEQRSLGPGGRGGASRGRLQVAFVPRALQKKEAPAESAAPQAPTPKSNADFRGLLLSKK